MIPMYVDQSIATTRKIALPGNLPDLLSQFLRELLMRSVAGGLITFNNSMLLRAAGCEIIQRMTDGESQSQLESQPQAESQLPAEPQSSAERPKTDRSIPIPLTASEV